MMATGSPRASAPASPAKPATRGVPPRISTFTTATSAESATPTSRPANHWRLPENLIAIRRGCRLPSSPTRTCRLVRSEEHTSELQSQSNLVCRLLLEKKKINQFPHILDATQGHLN